MDQKKKELTIAMTMYHRGVNMKKITAVTGVTANMIYYHIHKGHGSMRKSKGAKPVNISMSEDVRSIIKDADPDNISKYVCDAIIYYSKKAKR